MTLNQKRKNTKTLSRVQNLAKYITRIKFYRYFFSLPFCHCKHNCKVHNFLWDRLIDQSIENLYADADPLIQNSIITKDFNLFYPLKMGPGRNFGC